MNTLCTYFKMEIYFKTTLFYLTRHIRVTKGLYILEHVTSCTPFAPFDQVNIILSVLSNIQITAIFKKDYYDGKN